jgi:CRP/FNR family transcriptional regulator, cyclic AMP receptor protein
MSASAAEFEGIGLFGALDDDTLELLAKRLPVVEIDANAVVYSQNQQGRSMYVVLEGEVELTKAHDDGRVCCVAHPIKHDWFGELSLIDVMPRGATARALTPVRLLELRTTDLQAVYRSNLKAYALLVMNVARQLSRKLRVAETALAAHSQANS